MARSRAAPAPARSASSASSRPRPAASSSSATPARPAASQPHAQPAAQPQAQPASSGWFGSKPSAPPPAHAAPAAPPAMASGGAGGGIMSGLMGSVVTGVAMGTGSAIAHRAVDSMMGPRETKVVHEQAPAAMAPSMSAPMSDAGPCGQRVQEFADCMSRSNGDMSACSFYFDAMQSCKTANRLA